MNNTQYLGEFDFEVSKSAKGPVVATKVPGVVFVMFHADPGVCQSCDLAKPEFGQLFQHFPSAKFAYCNLSRNQRLSSMSFQTITPLNKVPLFIVFVNGRPFVNYTGERQFKAFAEFMQQVLQRLSQQQVQTSNGQVQTFSSEEAEKTPHGIAYDYDYVTVNNSSTLGSVTCEEGVCYLTSAESQGPMTADVRNQRNPMNDQVPLGQMAQANQRTFAQQPQPQQYMNRQQQQQPYYPPQQQQRQPQQPQPQQFQQPAYYPQVQQPYYPPQSTQNPNMTYAQPQYYPRQQPQQQQQQPQYYPQQQPAYNNSFYQG